jgi:hypothetical protein
MQYTVVKHFKIAEFEVAVTRCLLDGWKLQGGVAMTVNPTTGEFQYAQAMIKQGE